MGETEIEEDVATHFVALLIRDGDLYELDGRKPFPINHGKCEKSELLPKACAVVKTFMDRDPEEIRFTILAIAPPAEGEGGSESGSGEIA